MVHHLGHLQLSGTGESSGPFPRICPFHNIKKLKILDIELNIKKLKILNIKLNIEKLKIKY